MFLSKINKLQVVLLKLVVTRLSADITFHNFHWLIDNLIDMGNLAPINFGPRSFLRLGKEENKIVSLKFEDNFIISGQVQVDLQSRV